MNVLNNTLCACMQREHVFEWCCGESILFAHLTQLAVPLPRPRPDQPFDATVATTAVLKASAKKMKMCLGH